MLEAQGPRLTAQGKELKYMVSPSLEPYALRLMFRALSLLALKRKLLQLSLRKTGKRIESERVAGPMKDLAELIHVKHGHVFFLPFFFMNFWKSSFNFPTWFRL